MFRAIRAPSIGDPFAPCSVHLSESAEEVRVHSRRRRAVARAARGARRRGTPAWVAAGRAARCSISTTAGFSDAHVLAVHGVQMTPRRSRAAGARGATLVTCPRSNGQTGAGAPPIEDFYASGVRVAVGTDSLASAPDLNVFAELADDARASRRRCRRRRCSRARRSQGAAALGFDADFGTIEPGKRARPDRRRVPAGDGRCGRIPGRSGIAALSRHPLDRDS